MPNLTCSADDCTRPAERREWCNAHYRRLLRAGALPARVGACKGCGDRFPVMPTGVIPSLCEACRPKARTTCMTCDIEIPRSGVTGQVRKYCSDDCKPRCAVEGCNKPIRKFTWCGKHYSMWWAYGDADIEPNHKWADTWRCLTCGNTSKSTWKTQRRSFCTEPCKVI